MYWWKSGLRSSVCIPDLGVTWMEIIVNKSCERVERLWPHILGGGRFQDGLRRKRNLKQRRQKDWPWRNKKNQASGVRKRKTIRGWGAAESLGE